MSVAYVAMITLSLIISASSIALSLLVRSLCFPEHFCIIKSFIKDLY